MNRPFTGLNYVTKKKPAVKPVYVCTWQDCKFTFKRANKKFCPTHADLKRVVNIYKYLKQ